MVDERTLLEQIAQYPVVDTHEHTPPEHERLGMPWDVFSLMLQNYIGGDLRCAGLSDRALATVLGSTASVGEKWELLREAWPLARQTAYGRVVRLALKRFFGEDDFADGGAERATERLETYNVPGVYERVFVDACNIRAVLTQRVAGLEPGEDTLFRQVARPSGLGWVDRGIVEAEEQRTGQRLATLEDFLQSLREHVVDQADKGAVGLKAATRPIELPEPVDRDHAAARYGPDAFPPLTRPSMREAQAAFARLMDAGPGGMLTQDHRVVCAATMHFFAELAESLDLVMVIHTGAAWDSWLDFRVYRPTHLIPLLNAHRGTRFDLYHAGIPWTREMAKIAKVFPNTWIDLTWAHIVSPEMTVSFLDELLDMVPPNKVLGFGGDYGHCVENAYGHLVIARENIARVLARRIDKGLLTPADALTIARSWLWDNPIALYGLEID